MRLLVLFAMTISPVAHAAPSFARNTISVATAGFAGISSDVDWGIGLTVEYARYVGAGFELFARVPIEMVHSDWAEKKDALATGFGFGGRFLIREERVRPFVDLEAQGRYLFRDAKQGNRGYLGVLLGVGVMFFVSDVVALGFRAEGRCLFTLNAKPLFFAGGSLILAAHL